MGTCNGMPGQGRKIMNDSSALFIGMLLIGAGFTTQLAAQPLPDLTVNPDVTIPLIVTKDFSSTHCAVAEGCAEPGIRTLLRFATETRNIGNADLVLGNPVDNELFHFHDCHNHYHMEDYADYRLVDDQGIVVSGFKSSFCLLDSYRFDPCANPVRIYNCSNQGLQVGWADIYTAGLDCQWIDITGVAGGHYSLEIEVNPELILEESDYTNNTISVPVTIPPVCGDENYPHPVGDYTLDCRVNMLDIADLYEGWIAQYQLEDLAQIASNWLECTHPYECP